MTIKLLDQVCIAQIWLLSNSMFVWMGSGAERPRLSYVCILFPMKYDPVPHALTPMGHCSTMSTAVATPYSPMPLITTVLGAPEMEEQQIAQRLAQRTGRQCFVSCQLPDHLPELFSFAEQKLIERLALEGLVLVKAQA